MSFSFKYDYQIKLDYLIFENLSSVFIFDSGPEGFLARRRIGNNPPVNRIPDT